MVLQAVETEHDVLEVSPCACVPHYRREASSLTSHSGLGVKHTSRLTVPDADGVAPGLHVGERAPYAIVTRHSDWQQFSLLELMLYNGRSKLVLLPGDTRNPAIAQRLACFVESLVESVGGKVGKLLDVFTVLNTPKEAPFKLERRMPILCTDEKWVLHTSLATEATHRY